MTFEQLESFLQERMRMSHVYQPAMILCLLENGGIVTQEEFAEAFVHSIGNLAISCFWPSLSEINSLVVSPIRL